MPTLYFSFIALPFLFCNIIIKADENCHRRAFIVQITAKYCNKSIFCGSAPSSNSMTVIRMFNAQPDNTHIGIRAPRRFSLSRRLSDKPHRRYFSSPHLYRIFNSTANFHSPEKEYILFYHIYNHLSIDLRDFLTSAVDKFSEKCYN